MYQCTPKQLAENTGEHFFEMLQDLKCRNIEAKVQKANQSLKAK
jgi:hypothetical protein